MSVEFEELLKARENPSEEAQSKSGCLLPPLGWFWAIFHSWLLIDLVEFTDEEGYGRYLDLHDCYLKYINLKSSEALLDPVPSFSGLVSWGGEKRAHPWCQLGLLTCGHRGCLDRDTERNKDVAFLEAQIYEYVEILGEQRQLTHENVQRKQARTGEEREEEEEEQISESESEDEENEIIYNPKNLPLGWDGKPIPYWLYKLHGLNINYNCEICGNYTYRGPKAFQRHFAEWRHAHGMRCLGIPNTAHFANVTQIEDAVSRKWAQSLFALTKGREEDILPWQGVLSGRGGGVKMAGLASGKSLWGGYYHLIGASENSPVGVYLFLSSAPKQDLAFLFFSVGQAEATEGFREQLHLLFQEEYEDSSGNVVNKKTYEDLKRQGLL
ncbi:Splicing factor 3A subunit 3 [Ophiophagus hannah]|uniref:Splicing factor 3A subunit 3 n=1 Tax=Ophiophagus hannah TaxID=8665 RepID=V8NE45_OPHHA|nr:Splicing factor 3A subunit 3 [Ophiophagus hannah]